MGGLPSWRWCSTRASPRSPGSRPRGPRTARSAVGSWLAGAGAAVQGQVVRRAIGDRAHRRPTTSSGLAVHLPTRHSRRCWLALLAPPTSAAPCGRRCAPRASCSRQAGLARPAPPAARPLALIRTLQVDVGLLAGLLCSSASRPCRAGRRVESRCSAAGTRLTGVTRRPRRAPGSTSALRQVAATVVDWNGGITRIGAFLKRAAGPPVPARATCGARWCAASLATGWSGASSALLAAQVAGAAAPGLYRLDLGQRAQAARPSARAAWPVAWLFATPMGVVQLPGRATTSKASRARLRGPGGRQVSGDGPLRWWPRWREAGPCRRPYRRSRQRHCWTRPSRWCSTPPAADGPVRGHHPQPCATRARGSTSSTTRPTPSWPEPEMERGGQEGRRPPRGLGVPSTWPTGSGWSARPSRA